MNNPLVEKIQKERRKRQLFTLTNLLFIGFVLVWAGYELLPTGQM